MLISHTHCQATQSQHVNQGLPKSVSEPAQEREIKHESTTSCIVHLADSANIKAVTHNKRCNGLTGSCFESPNDTIHVTVADNTNSMNNIILIQ
jgi:hypothetical protein